MWRGTSGPRKLCTTEPPAETKIALSRDARARWPAPLPAPRIELRKLSQCAAAEELEQYLGDPSNPEIPFSFKRSVELDEKDEYPEESRRILSQWGYMDHFIPVAFGGKLKYLDESFLVTRVVSRRDLTVAVALAQTFVGALPVWV